MIWITINAFILDKSHIPLPFSADNCANETMKAMASNVTLLEPPELWVIFSFNFLSNIGGIPVRLVFYTF